MAHDIDKVNGQSMRTTAFEERRAQNMQQNAMVLQGLGLLGGSNKMMAEPRTEKKKRARKESRNEAPRKSARLAAVPSISYNEGNEEEIDKMQDDPVSEPDCESTSDKLVFKPKIGATVYVPYL